ncbi:MAG: HAD family hydrolase [Ruminococcus sp.]|nr:HAD family hydrolase [Ruminococcus sp.]
MANIILDFDGTIHDCAKIYVPAFRVGHKYLVDNNYLTFKEYSDKEVISYLGYSPKAMWEKFAPELDSKIQDEVTGIVYEEMKRLTKDGKSVLYNGAADALQALNDNGHRLFFLSNCARNYMELHRQAHHLDRFYTDFFCSEDFGYIPKPEIFKSIKEKYSGEYIIVGDRIFDLETALVHNLKSVGCTYGYCEPNELDRATVLIPDVSQLPQAVEKILK